MESSHVHGRFTRPAQAHIAQQPTANSFNPPPMQGNFRGLSRRRQVTDLVEAGRESTTAAQEEEDIQAQVDSYGRRWSRGWPLSKYRNVRVLLVQWGDENLGVDEEVTKLEAVLSSDRPKGYNFYTQRYSIPNDNSEDELTRRLLEFRKGATDNDLLILYYAGHAGGSAQECIWFGKPDYNSSRLNWHSIQGLLLGTAADVLLILDCCFATLAARNYGMGDNWMLGASNKETEAAGVARNSFTSTLTRELERCAYRYWSLQETLSAQSLDHAFVVWERDLDFTPKLTRLTDHECPATDLTPLLHPCQRPMMQTTRTEPTPQPRLQSISPPLPARPKDSSAPKSQEGLTCIYSSTKGPGREPTADVILVHGAYGHPINSFANHLAERLTETSWVRDRLPKELENIGIFPRVMTYGWNASAWYDPQSEVKSAPEDLAQALKAIHTKVPRRPLIFIGHGTGGLLIKQLVIEIINFGFSERNFQNPIQACFFLAYPELIETSNLTEIVPENHVALLGDPRRSPPYFGNLDSKATDASKISKEFDTIRKEWSIGCAFFKEVRKYTMHLNDSHLEVGLGEPSFKLDTNYVGAAKLPERGKSLSLVLDVMRRTLVKEPTQPLRPRPPNAERVFAKLKGYDTRFLVDDSDSMDGPRWTTAKQVMAQIASIAVKYDRNGVDVRFFNAYLEDEERLNLDSADKVMRLFENLDPDGSTPTADMVETELNEYIHEYKKNRSIKGLNLIVLTDGEPSPHQDVEHVIVKYARILAQQDAPPLQVGIQFVQIGDEEGAKDFLDSLDNDLQKKHDLDRDVSWLIFLQRGMLMIITDGGYRSLG